MYLWVIEVLDKGRWYSTVRCRLTRKEARIEMRNWKRRNPKEILRLKKYEEVNMEKIKGGEPKREQKHILLEKRFVRLGKAIGRIENLLSRVRGDPQSETETPTPPEKSPVITLLDFLATSPDRIDDYIDRLQKAGSELEEAIF